MLMSGSVGMRFSIYGILFTSAEELLVLNISRPCKHAGLKWSGPTQLDPTNFYEVGRKPCSRVTQAKNQVCRILVYDCCLPPVMHDFLISMSLSFMVDRSVASRKGYFSLDV